MRVAIAEDDTVYRAGLVELLTAADVAVACQVSSGRELLDYLAGELPERSPDGHPDGGPAR